MDAIDEGASPRISTPPRASTAKKLVNLYRSILFALSTVIILATTIIVSVVYYIKNGQSIGDISDLTQSTTAIIAAVLTTYTMATVLIIAGGRSNFLRNFANEFSRFLKILVGTSNFSVGISQNNFDVRYQLERDLYKYENNKDSIKFSPEMMSLISKLIEEKRALEKRVKSDPFLSIISRLEKFSGTILARSFFNLFVGVGLTIFSLVVLSKLVETIASSSQADLGFQLVVSRVGVAITSILLAYFFLDLYKKGLQDIKYVQDEITSIELKRIALTGDMCKSAPITQQDKDSLLSADRHLFNGPSKADGHALGEILSQALKIVVSRLSNEKT